MKLRSAVLAIVAAALWPRAGFADDLTLGTVDGASWPAAVAALQADVRGQGSSVHVVVNDASGRRIGCGDYSLSLDEVGARAFVLGTCDPATRATAVRLVDRAALFAPDVPVSRPLAAGISAVRVLTGGSRGGARTSGGSELTCSVAIHPFIHDLEHGTRVPLTPGRYVLRVLSHDVAVNPSRDGWSLRGNTTLTTRYEVVDTRDGSVLVSDRATLSCALESMTASGPPTNSRTTGAGTIAQRQEAACRAAEPIAPGTMIVGSTPGGTALFESPSHHSVGRERVFTLQISQLSNVSLRLAGDYNVVLHLRSRCTDPMSEIGSDAGHPRDYRHVIIDAVLQPGTYVVFADGFNPDDGGNFSLATTVSAIGETASGQPLQWQSSEPNATTGSRVGVSETLAVRSRAACRAAANLASGTPQHGSTAGQRDLFHGSRHTVANERVYALDIPRRSQVRIRLRGNHDVVLYVRSECNDAASEIALNIDAPFELLDGPVAERHRAALDLTLDRGTYFVFADGFNPDDSGAFVLSASVDPAE